MTEPTIYCGTYYRLPDGEMIQGPLVSHSDLLAAQDRIRALESRCDAKDDAYRALSLQAARERDEKDKLIAMLENKSPRH